MEPPSDATKMPNGLKVPVYKKYASSSLQDWLSKTLFGSSFGRHCGGRAARRAVVVDLAPDSHHLNRREQILINLHRLGAGMIHECELSFPMRESDPQRDRRPTSGLTVTILRGVTPAPKVAVRQNPLDSHVVGFRGPLGRQH